MYSTYDSYFSSFAFLQCALARKRKSSTQFNSLRNSTDNKAREGTEQKHTAARMVAAEKPLFDVDDPMQAYCVTLEEEQARLTKDVQDLKATVASQVDQISRFISVLAKHTLHQKAVWFQFHIVGAEVGLQETFRHVVDAVRTDLCTLKVYDENIARHLKETEMCQCSIIQYEEGLHLFVESHPFVETLQTYAGVRSHFSVLDKEILGQHWRKGGCSFRLKTERGKMDMCKLFSGEITEVDV